MFKSTYFEEHLRTSAALKICSWNWEKLRFIHNIRNFNFTLKNRFLKMIVFISLLVSHKVCIHIEYFFREVRNKLQILIVSSVNQKKIKSSRKEYAMWTCFKFWPMKSIFRKLQAKKVWLLLVYKFTENYCCSWLFSKFIQTQRRTSLDKIRILTWKLLAISS